MSTCKTTVVANYVRGAGKRQAERREQPGTDRKERSRNNRWEQKRGHARRGVQTRLSPGSGWGEG